MTWRPDERHRKTLGPFSLVPVRRGSETAHDLTLHDGRTIRLLPDPDTTGQRRSQAILKALKALYAAWQVDLIEGNDDEDQIDPLAVVAGYLHAFTWEFFGDAPECPHERIEGVAGLSQKEGESYVTVVCPACGQKWSGRVEPLATEPELARRGVV